MIINKQAVKRALWASTSRVIGVGLGVSAGSALNQLAGDLLTGWTMAILMAIASFVLMWVSEYEKEIIIVKESSGEQLTAASRSDSK